MRTRLGGVIVAGVIFGGGAGALAATHNLPAVSHHESAAEAQYRPPCGHRHHGRHDCRPPRGCARGGDDCDYLQAHRWCFVDGRGWVPCHGDDTGDRDENDR